MRDEELIPPAVFRSWPPEKKLSQCKKMAAQYPVGHNQLIPINIQIKRYEDEIKLQQEVSAKFKKTIVPDIKNVHK